MKLFNKIDKFCNKKTKRLSLKSEKQRNYKKTYS